MHLVDDLRTKILPVRVVGAGGLSGPRERLFDAAGDEVERGAALHLDGFARVMCEDEDRHVVWRVVAPPPSPCIIRPFTADGTEHVAAHDPRAEVLHAA